MYSTDWEQGREEGEAGTKVLLPLSPHPPQAALMVSDPLSTAQPSPLSQPRSHYGIGCNGSVRIPEALGQPEGKVDPSRARALPDGSEQLPLWQRPQGPEYTGHTSEKQGRWGSADMGRVGMGGGLLGPQLPFSQSPHYIPLLEPTLPTWAWGVGTMHTADRGGCPGWSDGHSHGTGTQLWGWQNNRSPSHKPGEARSTEEEWEGRPQRRKRWKNLRQSASGRREGQRIGDGQGHMGNNKGLMEPGAAVLGLGTGGAPILITFLLGLWLGTASAAPSHPP